MCKAPPASLGERPGTSSTAPLPRPRDIAVTSQPPHSQFSSFAPQGRAGAALGSSPGMPWAQTRDQPLAMPSAGSMLANPDTSAKPRPQPVPAPQQLWAVPLPHRVGSFSPTKHKHLGGVQEFCSPSPTASQPHTAMGGHGFSTSSCGTALRPPAQGTLAGVAASRVSHPGKPSPAARVVVPSHGDQAREQRDGVSPSPQGAAARSPGLSLPPAPRCRSGWVAGHRQPLQGHRQGSPPRGCPGTLRHRHLWPSPPRSRRTEPRPDRSSGGGPGQGRTDRAVWHRHRGSPRLAPPLSGLRARFLSSLTSAAVPGHVLVPVPVPEPGLPPPLRSARLLARRLALVRPRPAPSRPRPAPVPPPTPFRLPGAADGAGATGTSLHRPRYTQTGPGVAIPITHQTGPAGPTGTPVDRRQQN